MKSDLTRRFHSRTLCAVACTLVTISFPGAMHAADQTATWDNTDNKWTDSAHWSTALFPDNAGLTYDAVHSEGTITLDQDITIEKYTQSGGTLATVDPFTLTLNGDFLWTGGTMGGAGTTAVAGTLAIGGANSKNLGNGGNTGHTLINNATANLSGGTLFVADSGGANPGAQLINNGAFNALDEADISVFGGDGLRGVFTNSATGIFNKSGAGTTTLIQVPFNNAGTVHVASGTLVVGGGGSSSGAFSVDALARLTFGIFSGSAHTLTAASSVSGAGNVSFDGGINTFDGSYDVGGTTTVNSGTANFNTASTTGAAAISGGTLGGSGAFEVSGDFLWTGGSMGGAGATTIAGTLALSGPNSKGLGDGGNSGRILINNGAANLSGGTLFVGDSGGANPGAQLINNGAFNALDNAGIQTVSFGGSGPRGVFTNSATGTFNKSGAGTTTLIQVPFNNAGTVHLASGTLVVGGGGTSSGAFSVDALARLTFGIFSGSAHTLTAASSVSGAGNVSFDGGINTFDGSYDVGGTTTVNDGAANFDTASTTGAGAISGGTLGGSGAFEVSGDFLWTGGSMGGAGTTTIAGPWPSAVPTARAWAMAATAGAF